MIRIHDPKPLRWNKRAFRRLPDLFGVDRLRFELIDGEIIESPRQNESHSYAILLAQAALRRAFGTEYFLRPHMPLDLPGSNEPEPDIVVVRGALREQRKHPKTASLVLEVSDSTLRYDRLRKGSLYAFAGIRDYWIINLIENLLEVRREPTPDQGAEFGFSYADLSVYQKGDAVALLAKPRKRIQVSDLLP